MQGRVRALVSMVALLLSLAAWTFPARAGEYEERTFKDNWDTKDYFGNDGTHDFTGPWSEVGDDGNNTSGSVHTYAHPRCSAGNSCLWIGDFNDSFGSGLGAQRFADTADAQAIKLSFDYRRWIWEADNLDLKIQVYDGSAWKTVDTIPLTDGYDDDIVHWERGITGFASDTMGVRFKTSGGSAEGYILIDTVEIAATFPLAATTTTSSTTTTTTVPGTTTTTSSTTTTTTVPGTTTTSQPGATTTTSAPVVTTTMAVTTTSTPNTGSTTTTAPAGGTNTTTSDQDTTTTTIGNQFIVAPGPPNDGDRAEQEPPPLTPEEVADYSSKASMSLDDAMPMLMVPSGDESGAGTEATNGTGPGTTRTPTEGLMATFSTSTETLQAHSTSVVLLGVLIAWLAVRGLGRSRWGRRNTADVG